MLKPAAALRKDRTTDAVLERHFAFIAATIVSMTAGWEMDDRQEVARCFADACARTNPKFDRARFLRACNVEV